jgi:hypothetical protein
MIGEFTFCTKFIIGWNICNSKIKLKFTIDKFSNIDDKTIKIQHTYNNNISNISGEELIKFVTDNIDMILYKDPIENELQLNEMKLNKLKLNDLEVNDNNYDDIKLNKVNIDEIKQTLFIKLTKARKISYQSCLPYDDNKKKLEKIYGVNLDL